MATQPVYLIQGDNIIIVIDGDSHNIGADHANYTQIKAAILSGDWDTVKMLAVPAKTVEAYGAGRVEIKDGGVYWQGARVHSELADHMLRLRGEGFPIDPLVNFMTRLYKNPSKRSIDQCYAFVTRNKMPITPDGCILAFKRVRRETYKDIHSGTIRNAVGDVVTMSRGEVDDNPNSYCSHGLHFCSEEYLSHFGSAGDPVMIVKVDPADVVSVPADAGGSKARCCAYTVVAEVTGDVSKALASAVVAESDGNYAANTTTAVPASVKPVTYSLVRKSDNSTVVHTGLTKPQAELIIQRHKTQKKAALVMKEE